MSINNALYTGVTGLLSNSTALSAISQNIANANTVGYKRVGTDFQDLVTGGGGFGATYGGYDGAGVTTNIRNFVGAQGVLQSTGSGTDLAINGNGFFITSSGPSAIGGSNAGYFTRAGSFTVDKDGYLTNSAGYYLQGWPADGSGDVDTSGASLSNLVPINVLALNATASASTKADINGNLDSDQEISAAAATYASGDMSAYDADNTTGVKPDYSMTVPVYDSKGGSRNVVVDFLKTGANSWQAEVHADPASDVTGANGLIASGTVSFNADGSLNTSGLGDIDLGASGGAPGASGAWADSLGVSAQKITLDLSGLTQLSADSTVDKISSDGSAAGGMTGISIDKSGSVTAVFSNGSTRKIAQVAVATFANPDGLSEINGDAYQASATSGAYTLKTAGSSGAGNISPGSLEQSTVDLSTEFTNLIVTQRAYSASSKIITTADDMLQELISIKR